MCLHLATLQGGLYSWVVMLAGFRLWNEWYKKAQNSIWCSPKYSLLKNQVLEEFSHFFVAIFSLIFIGHLYQHLLLNSFILNHTSRLSSCKILLFLGCILKFPTWWDFPFFFFFFYLALTFAYTALLGFKPSGLSFLLFFIF